MSILLNNSPYDNGPWVYYLNKYLPSMDVWVYPEVPDPNKVKYAAIWDHPANDLERYPNLCAILNLGAGMDLIDKMPSLPRVPIVRLVDPEVGTDMAQYTLYWVLHFQRNFEPYRRYAAQREWHRIEYVTSLNYRVLVVGLGLIGTQIAEYLAANRFAVTGWSRNPKQVDGVTCVNGDDGLNTALAETDVVVNCLPYNSSTEGFLNEHKLGQLPKGANVINVSRGAVIDEAALIAALESKHIGAAALDVFVTEPLPQESPLWTMPNVFVTPHMSGATFARSACRTLADNIERLEAGEEAFPLYVPPQHQDAK